MNNILNLQNYFVGENNQYHSVYLITYLPTLKYYVGKHSGNCHPSQDKYVCSTTNSELIELLKTNPSDFTREIISYEYSAEDAYESEGDRIPDDYDFGSESSIYFNLTHPSSRFGCMSSGSRSIANAKSRATNLKVHGHVMGNANLPAARKKIGAASKVTKTGRYGSAMGSCHSPEALEKRFNTQIEKYGSRGWARCSEPEIREKIAEKNRRKVYKFDLEGNLVKEFNSNGDAILNGDLKCARDWVYGNRDPKHLWLRESDLVDKDKIILDRVNLCKIKVHSDGKLVEIYEDEKHKHIYEVYQLRLEKRKLKVQRLE